MLFYSFFKTLVGKEIVVELKNGERHLSVPTAETAAELAYSSFPQRPLLERPIALRRTLAPLLHCDSQLVFYSCRVRSGI